MVKKRAPKDADASRVGSDSTGTPSIRLDIPQALLKDGWYAIWKPGGCGRLLGQLAREHAFGEATLTPRQLAELVDLFRDEPLPESLRRAVARQLRGQRVLKQGAPRKGQTAQAEVELMMLPHAYLEAKEESKVERQQMQKSGRKQGRYDDPNRLPTVSSMACDKVRKWLPTLASYKDRRLQNLVSEVQGRLSGEDD
jgi:hypothetical protein